MRIDPFTRRRLEKFVEAFRTRAGVLPTLQDFADNGFDKAKIEDAVKDQIIVKFYVTLTDGTIRKGYKLYILSV